MKKMKRINVIWKSLISILIVVYLCSGGTLARAELMSGYENITIALFRKTGNSYEHFASAETKGFVGFNSQGIRAGEKNITRIKFKSSPDTWEKLVAHELINGRVAVKTEDGKSYTIHSLDMQARGIIELGRHLSENSSNSNSKPSSTKGKVFEVQKKLVERGYNPGKPDGIWGGRTEAAIRKFQGDSGLPVSGKLDKATVERLGL
jgi:hypothetical protein